MASFSINGVLQRENKPQFNEIYHLAMTTLGNWTIPIFKNDKSSYIFYKLIIFHSKLFNNQREYPQALDMFGGWTLTFSSFNQPAPAMILSEAGCYFDGAPDLSVVWAHLTIEYYRYSLVIKHGVLEKSKFNR